MGSLKRRQKCLCRQAMRSLLSFLSLFVSLSHLRRRIEADISLTSNSSFGAGGTFGVHAHTTNGSIKIVYDDSPADSILKFDAHTTNSPVHAVLHPAYEGTFCLRTTLCKVVLDPLRDAEDPSGLGRRRRWSTHSVNKQAVCGGVDWSPSRNDGRAGSVDIKTTENLIRLSI